MDISHPLFAVCIWMRKLGLHSRASREPAHGSRMDSHLRGNDHRARMTCVSATGYITRSRDITLNWISEAERTPRSLHCVIRCPSNSASQQKRRPQISPRGRRQSKDAWQRGMIQIAPAVHSWYTYSHHEDCSLWGGGLAIVALASAIASPFFVLVLCYSA